MALANLTGLLELVTSYHVQVQHKSNFKLLPHHFCLSPWDFHCEFIIHIHGINEFFDWSDFIRESALIGCLLPKLNFLSFWLDSHKICIPDVHFFSWLNFYVISPWFKFCLCFSNSTHQGWADKITFCHKIYSYTTVETQTEHFRFEAFDWFNLIHLYCNLLRTEFYFALKMFFFSVQLHIPSIVLSLSPTSL